MFKNKQHVPEEGMIYKFCLPETGRVVSFRFLCENNENRLAFRNEEIGNVTTLTPARFSYLYANCLIEKIKTQNVLEKKEKKRWRIKERIKK